MKTIFYFLLISLLFFSCNPKEENIKGELFFKLVNVIPNEGLSEPKINEIETFLDSNKNKKDDLIDFYKTLKQNNILGNPNVDIKTNDTIIRIFLNKKEYQKISHFKLDSLRNKNKKGLIAMEIKKLKGDIYYSEKIISFKEVEGDTPYKK